MPRNQDRFEMICLGAAALVLIGGLTISSANPVISMISLLGVASAIAGAAIWFGRRLVPQRNNP